MKRCGWCKRALPARAKGQWRSAWVKDVAAAHADACPNGRRLRKLVERSSATGRQLLAWQLERSERRG
jgi:hypothetical protein